MLDHFTRLRLVRKSLIAGLVFACADHVQAGSIIYVDRGASGVGDGLSWKAAFKNLQDALAFSADSEHDVIEVRVAQGLYQPDRSAISPAGSGNREATFRLLSGVML